MRAAPSEAPVGTRSLYGAAHARQHKGSRKYLPTAMVGTRSRATGVARLEGRFRLLSWTLTRVQQIWYLFAFMDVPRRIARERVPTTRIARRRVLVYHLTGRACKPDDCLSSHQRDLHCPAPIASQFKCLDRVGKRESFRQHGSHIDPTS
jgi:hypothetical protein